MRCAPAQSGFNFSVAVCAACTVTSSLCCILLLPWFAVKGLKQLVFVVMSCIALHLVLVLRRHSIPGYILEFACYNSW